MSEGAAPPGPPAPPAAVSLAPRTRRGAWDVVLVLATVYAAVEIPLRIALEYPVQGPLLWADWTITALFVADIWLNFTTPGVGEQAGDAGGAERARRYLGSWFAIDFLATIPFDLLLGGGASAWAHRVARGLRLTRVVRLMRLAPLMADWERRHALNPSIIRLVFFCFWVAMTAHWIACGWVSIDDAGTAGETDPPTLYTRALYYTITTLATVGYGDITPKTNPGMVYAMVVMLLGVAVYGYVIGNLATLLANLDVSKAAHQERVERVAAHLKDRGVPPDLLDRIGAYHAYLLEHRMGGDDKAVLGHLPPSLQLDLALALNRKIVERVPIFDGAGDAFVRDLVAALRPVVYTPGDAVIRHGEIGREMFFISRGRVDVLSADERTTYATLTDGDFFGEMALLRNEPRGATIRARDFCQLYTCDQESFERIIERHPAVARRMYEVAEQRTRPGTRRDAAGGQGGGPPGAPTA